MDSYCNNSIAESRILLHIEMIGWIAGGSKATRSSTKPQLLSRLFCNPYYSTKIGIDGIRTFRLGRGAKNLTPSFDLENFSDLLFVSIFKS